MTTTESRTLPELSEQSIDRMEAELFAAVHAQRTEQAATSRRRRTGWMTAGAAAAVVVVAAVVTPLVTGSLAGVDRSAPDVAVAPFSADGGSVEFQMSGAEMAESAAMDSSAQMASSAGREVITSAEARLRVADATAAAEQVTAAAEEHGGYVESISLDARAFSPDGATTSGMMYGPVGQWVTVRVPSDTLTAMISDLSGIGEVEASTLHRFDVTGQAVDLRAHVEASEASVQRLTELMGQAESVADLLAAEQALAERQAILESYQQQLAGLEEQVAMSSLMVTLMPDAEPTTADPDGFGDGIAAGWNGLVATVNAVVVAAGFVLPWLAVAVVAGLIVWAIVALIRRRRRARDDFEPTP